jgi:hypothetical protein
VGEDGVFVHEVSGNTIAPAFRLGGPSVAANPQDEWVLVMGTRVLVVTQAGEVFARDITGTTIGVPFQLGGPKVAANPQDKWLLAMGARLLVITKSGDVFVHEVSDTTIGVPFQLGGPDVAANPQDKWLLAMGNRLLVVTGIPVSQWNHSHPFLAVAPLSWVGLRDSWRYFAGLKADGQPDWQASEALAQPLPPSEPSPDGRGYHQCLGYFSVRFIAGWRKWAIVYTCNNDASAGYNIDNGKRGIYLRTAATPWGAMVASSVYL